MLKMNILYLFSLFLLVSVSGALEAWDFSGLSTAANVTPTFRSLIIKDVIGASNDSLSISTIGRATTTVALHTLTSTTTVDAEIGRVASNESDEASKEFVPATRYDSSANESATAGDASNGGPTVVLASSTMTVTSFNVSTTTMVLTINDSVPGNLSFGLSTATTQLTSLNPGNGTMPSPAPAGEFPVPGIKTISGAATPLQSSVTANKQVPSASKVTSILNETAQPLSLTSAESSDFSVCVSVTSVLSQSLVSNSTVVGAVMTSNATSFTFTGVQTVNNGSITGLDSNSTTVPSPLAPAASIIAEIPTVIPTPETQSVAPESTLASVEQSISAPGTTTTQSSHARASTVFSTVTVPAATPTSGALLSRRPPYFLAVLSRVLLFFSGGALGSIPCTTTVTSSATTTFTTTETVFHQVVTAATDHVNGTSWSLASGPPTVTPSPASAFAVSLRDLTGAPAALIALGVWVIL